MLCNFDQTLTNQALSPDDHIPLLQMKYNATILEDRFATFSGINWFAPEVTVQELTNNLEVGQSLRVRFKNHENPFNQVQVSDVDYKDGQTCPPQLDIDCAPGCISTKPSWRSKDILFDKLYRVGASYCVETERLTYGELESRFQENLAANQTVQAAHAWNQLICKSVANPATTLIPTDRACFPVHYIEAGSAVTNGYDVLTQVIAYMKAVFGNSGATGGAPVDYAIFAHRYLEIDLLGGSSTLHNYQATGIPTAWGNVDALVQGGWTPMPALPGGLWGQKILIAPDSVDLYTGSGANARNYNPFISADGSKYYVVLASKRSFYTGITPLMDMRRFPATCDNKNESIQESFLGFNDVLFPNEVFVIAFDIDCVPVAGESI